jgi:uncharacterized protein
MIIRLYDLKEEISVKGTLDGDRRKRPEDEDISFVSPIQYELRVSRTGENIRVQGPVRAKLSLACARCLVPFAYTVESHLDIVLAPKEKQPGLPEMELKPDELEVYFFEGEEIDLDPYVFEEVMLDLPIKALCADACKGICANCGKNLNIEECRCEKTGNAVLGEKLKSFLKER